MKRLLSLVCVICMVLLSGCSPKGTGVSENKKYLDQISKDPFVADFVLGDVYYKLPCEFKQFTDNGWVYEYGEDKENKYELTSVTLQPEEKIEMILAKENDDIRVTIANETKEPMKLNEKSLVGKVWAGQNLKNEDFIITKGGIRAGVSKDDVEKVLKDMTGFEKDDEDYALIKDKIKYLEVSTHEEVATVFTFNVFKDDNAYEAYKSDAVKAAEAKKNTEESKKKGEETAKQYPSSKYSDFVQALENDSAIRNYYGEFTVDGEASVSNSLTSFLDTPVYLLKDKSDNLYAMYQGSATKSQFTLKKGDKIKAWCSISSSDAVATDDGISVPLMSPTVVEFNGKEIYNFYKR